MSRYKSTAEHRHGLAERIGVLLVNSGTPDSPRPRDVRSFLAKLLGDPRVVELHRALWLPILHGIILRVRPFRSAKKYQSIWSARGSPLLAFSEDLRSALLQQLAKRVLAPISIELGMMYAHPGVAASLEALRRQGCTKLLVLPMFPQYCGASTGAAFDQVSAELRRWRWVPDLRFISEYHEHPGYIAALAASVRDHWTEHGQTDQLLVSFHGIPEQYFRDGDPYFCKCQKTARLLAEELQLRPEQWALAFQSKYGPGRWLKPYTVDTLEAMPKRGVRAVTTVCPGFAVDCLETLEEMDIENREHFMRAGGLTYQYVPALNARQDHARALVDLIAQHCEGWTAAGLEKILSSSQTASRGAASDES